MRIISQDGAIDVPYENADLERKGKIIYVWTLDNVYGSFASYSTEEKAIKAMEMCREKYLSRMELDGGYDIVNGCYVQPNYWVLPKVFQFPTDVILDAEREEEGIPDDIVYYLDCPMPEDGEEIIVTDGKRVWTDKNCIDIVGHCLESGNDWKDIKAWIPLPKPYKKGGNND